MRLVGLDAVGEIMQVGAHLDLLALTGYRSALGLHLNFKHRSGLGPLGHVDAVKVHISRTTCQALHLDAPDGDLLHELRVIGVDGIQPVNLVVLNLVCGRVPENHKRMEITQRLE